VNAGGDLRAFGPRVHAVTLRDPRSPGRSMCRIGLRDKALASTGGTFDLFRSARVGNCATIDPQRRAPVVGIRGATVLASCCVIADALTKVVMIAGEGAAPLLDHFGADALFMSDDGKFRVTSDWPDFVDLAA
jgi:thiamine biosynthesis lipoprotein